MDTKECNKCGVEKPLEDFYFRKDQGKHRKECKVCQNETKKVYRKNNPKEIQRRRDQRMYNLTKSQLNLVENTDSCELCGDDISGYVQHKNRKLRKKCIDHDHNTGEFRGVLCKDCNTALGHFKDNKETIMNALKYLDK